MKDYPYHERVLPTILQDKAERLGDRPFLTGDQDMTYRDLRDRVARLGGGLASIGVCRGDRVLTMLPNTPDAILSFMAISWIGAIEVPINTMYRGKMLAYVAADADASLLIIHRDYLDVLVEVLPEVPSLRQVVVCGGGEADVSVGGLESTAWDAIAAAPAAQAASLAPGDLHAIMYTSGTTGPSKGVMVPYHHSYQYANPTGTHFIADGDVVYVTLPLFHIGGQWAGVYAALLADGKVVLKSKFSVGDFWEDVDLYGVTHTTLLGAMAEFIWKQPASPTDRGHPLERVTIAPAPKEAARFAERFGVRIAQGWGLTETGCVTAPAPLDQPANDPSACGRVRTDLFELRLVDANDEDVGRGTPGEAVVRSKQPFALMSGYWRKPEATVQAWRNLWLHTGDVLVEREDGLYTFVDRQKDCIRRRGENISSLEVEMEVLTHPDVRECAAVPVPTEDSEDEVKVVIALRDGSTLTPPELHAYLVPRMPAFMVPRYIEILPELPKTLTLKVKKDVLRAAPMHTGVWDERMSHV